MARLIRNPDGSFRVEADEPLAGQARSSYYDPRTAGMPGITTRPSPASYVPYGSGVRHELGSGAGFTFSSPTQQWTSPYNMNRAPQNNPSSNSAAVLEAIRRRRAMGPTPSSNAGKSFIPGYAAGGTPTLNPSPRPQTPFVSRPGMTSVNGVNAGAPRTTRSGAALPMPSIPGALGRGNPPGQGMSGMAGPQDPVDRLRELAMQLAGGVGAYPGAVQMLMPQMPQFERFSTNTDLAGLFDPIQQEYAPVLDTLYNNLQGSMGNIQQNLQNQWQGVEDQLSGQWAGLEQDQQQAYAEKDAELRRLATELGVPESAMMTDPNLAQWGRENERLKQLNATLKTGSMGTLNTLAESTAQGIGAYQPALEAARGQSLAEMISTLAGEKGQLASDLTGLETQYNTQTGLNEQNLYEQLVGAARDTANQEYERRVQGWSMRNQAAQDAMKNWEDFYLQKQKQEADAAAAAQNSELIRRMMESTDTTTSENSDYWAPVMSAAGGLPGGSSRLQDLLLAMGGSGSDVGQYLKQIQALPARTPWISPDAYLKNTGLEIPFSTSPVSGTHDWNMFSKDQQLAKLLEDAGLFQALNAGKFGIPSQTVRTQRQDTLRNY